MFSQQKRDWTAVKNHCVNGQIEPQLHPCAKVKATGPYLYAEMSVGSVSSNLYTQY